jgi:hypothetical protein
MTLDSVSRGANREEQVRVRWTRVNSCRFMFHDKFMLWNGLRRGHRILPPAPFFASASLRAFNHAHLNLRGDSSAEISGSSTLAKVWTRTALPNCRNRCP